MSDPLLPHPIGARHAQRGTPNLRPRWTIDDKVVIAAVGLLGMIPVAALIYAALT